jgi:hypothetical protein
VSIYGGTIRQRHLQNNMEKNKLYAIIFVLILILILLVGGMNMFAGRTKEGAPVSFSFSPPLPTTIIVIPTKYPLPTPTITLAPEKNRGIFTLSFPVYYNGITVEYLPHRNLMIVFYSSNREEAEALFNQLLSANSITAEERAALQVEFIGERPPTPTVSPAGQ